ncbi:MAG: hypothetical protein O3A84_12865 [Proteobacteria bacterium]|nr:hypothetical protein [Pseudomonadota bacterium]
MRDSIDLPGTSFPERADRLAEIAKDIETTQRHPLLRGGPLPAGSAQRLRDAVNLYLYVTLGANWPDRPIPISDNILEEQADLIGALPNVTPNGLVLPKRETYLAYNHVHAEVVKIFEEAGLHEHVETIFAPINVRLVNGTPSAAIDSRPRASTKYHSDMWAGEPADAIMVFLPVLGDTQNVGVHWVEPVDFPKKFRGPLEDFDEGRALSINARDYDARFRNGDIMLTDPFLIHATQKLKDANRISIDFRFIAKEKAPEDVDIAHHPGLRARDR